MTFAEAIAATLDGKQVQRPTWDSALLLSLTGGELILHWRGVQQPLLIERGDITATDWEIVEP